MKEYDITIKFKDIIRVNPKDKETFEVDDRIVREFINYGDIGKATISQLFFTASMQQ